MERDAFFTGPTGLQIWTSLRTFARDLHRELEGLQQSFILGSSHAALHLLNLSLHYSERPEEPTSRRSLSKVTVQIPPALLELLQRGGARHSSLTLCMPIGEDLFCETFGSRRSWPIGPNATIGNNFLVDDLLKLAVYTVVLHDGALCAGSI